MARLLVAFCQYESCGKCFPCKLGMTQLLEMIERIADRKAAPGDVDLMDRVGTTMESTSLCFHGQLGYNPLRSALMNFPDDFRAHIEEGRCPYGDCDDPLLAPRNTRAFAEEYRTGAAPVQVLTR
jgi:NADH:ubiquinone oxidoreductase subunit F (NADH-binding)